MRSEIHISEMVDNSERKFGSTLWYYPVWIVDGEQKAPALFTKHQLDEAIERATANPEDIPERQSLLKRLFG